MDKISDFLRATNRVLTSIQSDMVLLREAHQTTLARLTSLETRIGQQEAGLFKQLSDIRAKMRRLVPDTYDEVAAITPNEH